MDGLRAKIASHRERKEPTPTAYLYDTPRGRRRSRSGMDGDLQPQAIDLHGSREGPFSHRDHVIRDIERYRDEAQVSYLVWGIVGPGLPHSKAMAGIRFFGQAVIPEFRMVGFPSEVRRRTRAA